MQRWKLIIEYNGGPFSGWQRQEDGIASVQQIIETAIEKFSGETVRLHVAGRTDAGVHARGQCAHFDLERQTSAEEIQGALNFHIKPKPIAILAVEAVDETFHARFGAKTRHYTYKIICRRAPVALEAGLAWHIPQKLDLNAMQQGANLLLGTHDFTSFRAAACQANSSIRTLDTFQLEQISETEIHAHVSALSFLHHQVRNMVGTLALVGHGKWQLADMKAALDAKDRAAGGPTAPPDGLYFMKVDY